MKTVFLIQTNPNLSFSLHDSLLSCCSCQYFSAVKRSALKQACKHLQALTGDFESTSMAMKVYVVNDWTGDQRENEDLDRKASGCGTVHSESYGEHCDMQAETWVMCDSSFFVSWYNQWEVHKNDPVKPLQTICGCKGIVLFQEVDAIVWIQ